MTTERTWTREGAKGNNFLYNGGTEANALTSLYDLDFRNYDPILGRMTQVDPMADKYGGLSTYNFGFNDPVFWNDPMGADPDTFSPEVWDMINRLWNAFANSEHGGSWSRSEGLNRFDSKEEAAGWIVNNFGSIGATEDYAFAKAMGMAQGASWVHWKYDYRWRQRNGSNVSFVYVGSGGHANRNGPGGGVKIQSFVNPSSFHFVHSGGLYGANVIYEETFTRIFDLKKGVIRDDVDLNLRMSVAVQSSKDENYTKMMLGFAFDAARFKLYNDFASRHLGNLMTNREAEVRFMTYLDVSLLLFFPGKVTNADETHRNPLAPTSIITFMGPFFSPN